MNDLNNTVCYDEPELEDPLTSGGSKLSSPLSERARLSKEKANALLTEMEEAKRRMRIRQIKKRMTESSALKKQGSFMNKLPRFFGRSDKKQQPPAKPQTDAYSIVAVCDTNDIGDCMQLEFAPLSMGTPKSLAQKYLSSPATSDSSCDVTVESSQAEF